MAKLELDGWIVKEGNDMENKLFFYSYKPVQTACDEFSVGKEGDNVFEIMRGVMGEKLQSFRCGTMNDMVCPKDDIRQ